LSQDCGGEDITPGEKKDSIRAAKKGVGGRGSFDKKSAPDSAEPRGTLVIVRHKKEGGDHVFGNRGQVLLSLLPRGGLT